MAGFCLVPTACRRWRGSDLFPTERLTPGVSKAPDTGQVLGSAFTRTLREAQAGDEEAFTRLWRDANPMLIRYLRVIGANDPYDAACEGWISAVRGLIGFTGDESAWRVWLLECARLRAEQGTQEQGWTGAAPTDRRSFSQSSAASSAPAVAAATAAAAAATAAARATRAARAAAATAAAASMARMTGQEAGDDLDLDLELLLESTPMSDPEHRGLADTITALRDLPLGQGEILVLRLLGVLPVRAVCEVVGSDAETVRRSESRALERLGTDRELISWSLGAPATPAELADERVALGAFRSIPRPAAWTVPRTRVLTVGDAPVRRPDGRTRGISNAAGRSRTALLGIAMVSASVMSLGGLSAAAYVGALPTAVQQVMSEKIGAPAPGAARANVAKQSPRSRPSSRVDGGPAAAGANVATSTAVALCRAWDDDEARGTPRGSSGAFRTLSAWAGGASRVEAYCAKVSVSRARVQPLVQVTGSVEDANPTRVPRGTTSPTAPPVLQGTGSTVQSPASAEPKTPGTASPTAPRSTPDPTGTDPTSSPSPSESSTPTPTPSPSESSTPTPTPTATTVPDQTPSPTSDPEPSTGAGDTVPTG